MANRGWLLAIIASLVSEMDKCVNVFQRDVAEHEEAVVPEIIPEVMWYHPNIRRGSPCGTIVGVHWFGCSVILIEKVVIKAFLHTLLSRHCRYPQRPS